MRSDGVADGNAHGVTVNISIHGTNKYWRDLQSNARPDSIARPDGIANPRGAYLPRRGAIQRKRCAVAPGK
jgi:hypothetical protein